LLLIAGVAGLGLIALILALPCEACRRRRARLEAAYAAWRELQLKK
jgi:hypothetical protein